MQEIHKGQLEILANNELMLAAIKGIFEERINEAAPDIERTDNDKLIGEKYRAYQNSNKLLNEVLKEIASFSTKAIKNKETNKGVRT